ncbi:MAG TPA: 5'/3'-nucleotidase SurE [Desulfuromonadales bacterium]|nr:5'/3'-nucleotidase SurE [Desulfuromonadales bacterium]
MNEVRIFEASRSDEDVLLILVTNDDGVFSPGLKILAKSLASLGRVVVAAPDRERSGVSHSLTLHLPLRAEELKPDVYAIDGTPTDCINLGVHALLKTRPDLVVSGINKGGNLGDDITYSGTVSAAMEATVMGVQAIAVSLISQTFNPTDFSIAATFATELAKLVSQRQLPPDTFLNVNVPPGIPKGSRLTRQGKRSYDEAIVENVDPRGRKYYWIGGGKLGFQNVEGTDVNAVHDGYISITPLHLDLTNYHSFDTLSDWGIESL